jgi:hypothetical protein
MPKIRRALLATVVLTISLPIFAATTIEAGAASRPTTVNNINRTNTNNNVNRNNRPGTTPGANNSINRPK